MGEQRLTTEIRYTLSLAKHGIWGTKPERYDAWLEAEAETASGEDGMDWSQIRHLAVQMQLDPFVQFALKLGDGLDYPREEYRSWTIQMRQKALGRILAAEEVEKLQREWEERGVRSAVVKGLAVASAYANPELRSGCDIDLYVEEENEQQAYALAKEMGCKVEPRISGTHHGEIFHPLLGLMELHVSLCNADEALVESLKDRQAVLLRPVRPFVTVETSGSRIVTIDHTEHIQFLISHMINHYIHGEASVRHISDVNAFAAAYGAAIDWDVLLENLQKLRYDKFFGLTLILGNHYLGFSHDGEMLARLAGAGAAAEQAATELLLDYLREMPEKEAAVEIYDAYCRRAVSPGIASAIFKLRILGRNVRTALQLRRQMAFRDIVRIGRRRVENLLLGGGKKTHENVSQRLEIMEQAGLFDRETLH